MPKQARIVKILDVVDTREYEEGPDDKTRPIPGSGLIRECDRCGRLHEVHAQVLLDDGTKAIVGTGCMHKDEIEVISKVRSMVQRQMRIRRLKCELECLRRKQEAWDDARRKIEALPIPEIVHGIRKLNVGTGYEDVPTISIGKHEVWCGRSLDVRERERCLIESWRDGLMAAHGLRVTRPHGEDDLERRIMKLELAQKQEMEDWEPESFR